MAKRFLQRFDYENFYVWDAMPMFKLVVVFIIGLLLAPFLQISFLFAISCLTGVLLLRYILLKNGLRIGLLRIRWLNILILSAIFFLGIAVYDYHKDKSHSALEKLPKEKCLLTGIVCSEITSTRSGHAFNLKIIQAADEHLNRAIPFRIRVFLKSDTLEDIQYGDLLTLHLKLSSLPRPNNPGEFDYGRYLQKEGISFVAYCTADNILSNNKSFHIDVRYYALKCRDFLEAQFIKGGLRDDELGIADALLLGKRSEISKDLMRAFSGAGTVHILAVSGLHVGMLYGVLIFMFGFIKRMKWLYFFLLILFLWAYAFITGLSPSVMRATVMFSFMAFGHLLSRKVHVVNSLAASAFFLLLIDPNLLYKVGFQLSYLAVLGIVCFQPHLAQIYEPKHKLINYCWQLVTVSIAAQIATAPIGLLYFHQFPNYFIVANLFAIPLAFLIVLNGMIVLAVSPIPLLLTAFTFILNWLIKALNYCINFISSLPGSVSSNIFFDVRLTVLFYFLLILLFAFITTRERSVITYALSALSIFLLVNTFQSLQKGREAIYFLYDKNDILIGLGQNKTFLWQALRKDSSSTIHSSIVNIGLSTYPKVQQAEFLVTSKDGMKFLNVLDKSIAVIDRHIKDIHCRERISIDYCILSDNPRISNQALFDCMECRKWIFAANNSQAYIRKIKKVLENNGVVEGQIYNIKESGYFSARLQRFKPSDDMM